MDELAAARDSLLFTQNRIQPEATPQDPNWLPDERMPSLAQMELTTYEQNQLEEMAKKFKLTPATQAFFLENRKIPRDAPLKWFPAKFLQHISIQIALGVARGGARIIVSGPPRHGKSKLSTVHGPLWVLENFSDKNVVTTCYGADLAEDFSREIREFIVQNPDVLDVKLRADANRIAKFLTNKNGALTSIGLGGPITGRGADVLFIDDYIKQIKEANSRAYRDYVWDWFRTTAMTRLEPGASVIIIATRWHHDDLIGRVVKTFGTQDSGGEWQHIKYHAIAREGDPLGREVGEALFPQRYSVKTLNERRALLGTLYYDALFDQEPHENTSDLTKKEWIVKRKAEDIPNKQYKFVRVWDFAGTEEQKSDYTAGGLMMGDLETQECGLLNMIRKQLTAAKVETLVKKTAEDDGPGVEIVICQETGSAGKAVISHYQNNVLKGFKVKGHYWNTGKEIVAQPWLAACENGKFWILEAPWNQAFIDEFGEFPGEGSGYHDDQIDVCANGHIALFGKKLTGGAFGRKKKGSNGLIIPPNAQELLANLPVDHAEAAKLVAQIEAEKLKTSPHRALLGGKTAVFGVTRSATFGRGRARNYG